MVERFLKTQRLINLTIAYHHKGRLNRSRDVEDKLLTLDTSQVVNKHLQFDLSMFSYFSTELLALSQPSIRQHCQYSSSLGHGSSSSLPTILSKKHSRKWRL
jgi:hypothetical protein